MPVTTEFRFRHRDGSWRILQAIGRSVPNQASDGFIIVNSRDVTEHRRLEEQLRQAQKMEAIGQLAGGVAHDFNNILAVVQIQSGLLKMEGGLSEDQLGFVAGIESAAQRAANLTRQLLLFSRRQTLKTEDLDLNEVVASITKMLQRIVGEDISMHMKLCPGTLGVHGDSGMIDQILLNLAVNARDAMPEGGHVVVETSAASFGEWATKAHSNIRPGEFVCLTVSDTGCGIPEDVMPKIFEPFFTTKAVGKGTGLGLATVFGIVEQHKGWIDVQSQPGHGTKFSIYFPRLPKVGDATVNGQGGVELPRGDETILLVEDDATLRDSVRSVLTGLGYRILEADSGVSALAVWTKHRHEIDMLLTDLIMPEGMTGKELAERLFRERPQLKVLYTSGYTDRIIGKDFQPREGIELLSKPCQPHQLAVAVRNRLNAE